jgi:hypothetical protein
MLNIVLPLPWIRLRDRCDPRTTGMDGLPDGGTDVQYLHQEIEDQRAFVDCTQRSVARGRGTVVDAQCRVLQFRDRSTPDGPGNRTGTEIHRRLQALVERLDDSHRRLLLFSADIEMEIDRLDVTRAEIDRLTNAAGNRDSGQ